MPFCFVRWHGREVRRHGGAAERRRSDHCGAGDARRRNLHEIGRGRRREGEIAHDDQRAEAAVAGPGASVPPALIVVVGTTPIRQGCRGVDGHAARQMDVAVDDQRAAIDLGLPCIGADAVRVRLPLPSLVSEPPVPPAEPPS